MISWINPVLDSLDIRFTTLIILVFILLGGIIWFAPGFRTGLIMNFIIAAVCYMWFRSWNLEVAAILTVVIILVIMLTLSLYMLSRNASSSGGFT